MKPQRWMPTLLGVVVLLAATVFLPACAGEAPAPTPAPEPAPKVEYPTKPITIGCWSSPGAPNDLLARELAKVGEKYFGVSMTVVTKKGGGGANDLAWLLQQPADGHFVSTCTVSMPIRLAVGKLPYTGEEFKYVIRIQDDSYVIACLPDKPYNNLKEFFEYAKEHPEVTVGGYGSTDAAHYLAFARLAKLAGNPEVRWIPYEGGADAVTGCLGGHVDVVHSNWGTIGEHYRAGTLKVLGISSAERVEVAPDVPTYKEQGYDIVLSHWRGVLCSKDVPDEVVTKMRELFKQTIHDPEFEKFMADNNVNYADTFASWQEFTQWFHGEVATFKEILREVGVIQ